MNSIHLLLLILYCGWLIFLLFVLRVHFPLMFIQCPIQCSVKCVHKFVFVWIWLSAYSAAIPNCPIWPLIFWKQIPCPMQAYLSHIPYINTVDILACHSRKNTGVMSNINFCVPFRGLSCRALLLCMLSTGMPLLESTPVLSHYNKSKYLLWDTPSQTNWLMSV